MSSEQLLTQLRKTQLNLLEIQEKITTGRDVVRPSDAPDKASSLLFLQQSLDSREQYDRNLNHSLHVLSAADQSLGEAAEIVREARTIASSQIGVGPDLQSRQTQSNVIENQIDALLTLANRKFNGVPLFSGNQGAVRGEKVFEDFLGGIRYNGSTRNLEADVGSIGYQAFTSNGLDAFGTLSTPVQSGVDLDPHLTYQVRIADINGAQFEGVTKGSVLVVVNGTRVTVDLKDADTMGDVVIRINDGINGVSLGAGFLSIDGPRFNLTATAGHTIEILDVSGGQTAADLGIELSAVEASSITGSDVNVWLTPQTLLEDLGPAVDFSSGLLITQGATTKTADFSTAATVGDLINTVDQLDIGLRLQINASRNGLDLITEVSGIELSIGENGGSTATDLGIRTYDSSTELDDFRRGLGVESVVGQDDFKFTLHDSRSFRVNLDGVATIGDLINAIQNSAASGGIVVGVDFVVSHASNGNGLIFMDNTLGLDSFRIENLGMSLAADHLGITKNAGGDLTIHGDDNAKVRVEGIFTDLINLRDALQLNDEFGITFAGDHIEKDLDKLTQAHAQIGIEGQRVERQQESSKDVQMTEQKMLSELQDVELTEVITRFVQLQQQLQASLQVGAQFLRTSLLDFLR